MPLKGFTSVASQGEESEKHCLEPLSYAHKSEASEFDGSLCEIPLNSPKIPLNSLKVPQGFP